MLWSGNSARDFVPTSWNLFARMKKSLLAISLSLFCGLTLVTAQDKKDDKPKPDADKPAASADKKTDGSAAYADPSKLKEKAPDTFKAEFDTTKGKFTVEVTRSLSPNGADRFYNLVKSGYFKDIIFFRVIPGFMAQFGINGDPEISKKWRDANIADDPVKGSNTRGTITFATAGPNTRSTQFFINFVDNTTLDGMGFSPFGKVVEGMDVVDKINGEYGEGAPRGRGPRQDLIQTEGNAYLKKNFPNLDSIKSVTLVPAK